MSSLGISLLILVVVGVGGVAVYNFWLMRGHARSLTNLLVDRLDSPESNRRHEPTLADEPAASMTGSVQTVSPTHGQEPGPRSEPSFLDSLEEEIRTRGSGSVEAVSDAPKAAGRFSDDAGPASRDQEGPAGSTATSGRTVVRPWFGDHTPEPDWAAAQRPGPGKAEPNPDQEPVTLPAGSGPSDPEEPTLPAGEPAGRFPGPGESAVDDGPPAESAAVEREAPEAPEAPGEAAPPVVDGPARSAPSGAGHRDANDGAATPWVTKDSQDTDVPGGTGPAHLAPPAAMALTPGPGSAEESAPVRGPDPSAGGDPQDAAGQAQAAVPESGAAQAAVDEPVPTDDFHLTLLVETEAAQPGARLARITRDMHRVGAKPVEVLGRHVYADGSRRFEALRESMAYDALCLRLLLVNRQGPVNAMEYSEFASHAQRLNEELEVLVDLPDMSDVLARARELDEMIGPLDAQMAVNVEVPATLSPDEFARIALRLGLHEQTSQRFARIDRHGEPLFTAALTETAGRILLLLDVPRARSEGQPIREVVETAWKFAQAFEGRMVDDAGQPIDNALFERIENQLETLYHALDAQGLPAGSPLARRVFNL